MADFDFEVAANLLQIALDCPDEWQLVCDVLAKRAGNREPRRPRMVPVGRVERMAAVLDIALWLVIDGDGLRSIAELVDLDDEHKCRERDAARALLPWLTVDPCAPLMDVLNAIDDEAERVLVLRSAHVLGWDL